MDFTPSYTSAISDVKPQLKLFLALAVLTIPVVNVFGLDPSLSGSIMEVTKQPNLLAGSNFTFIGFAAISLYFGYLAIMLMVSFFGTIFSPESYYRTPVDTKYVDMPVIPNKASLFAFMTEVDGMTASGKVRMPDDHLNRLNIDKHGNLLEEDVF